MFMALMGDKMEPFFDENDGIDDEESSQDSLSASLSSKMDDKQVEGSKTTGSVGSKSEDSSMLDV